MIPIIYAIVIFIATFLGACAGLGGGVIIKPVLDFIGIHSLNAINFYSSSAVFTMAVYSTTKQLRNKVKFDYVMILLIAIGSIVGGNLGSNIFNFLLSVMERNILCFLQSIGLAILLIIVLLNVNVPHKNLLIKNKMIIIITGLALGMISSFFGIGGGPINVAVFIFFFSIDMKTATIYSIATILFSQASTLITIATKTGFGGFDLSLLFYTLPMAVLGGFFGTKMNCILSEKRITVIFNIVVLLIILLNIYNAIIAII